MSVPFDISGSKKSNKKKKNKSSSSNGNASNSAVNVINNKRDSPTPPQNQNPNPGGETATDPAKKLRNLKKKLRDIGKNHSVILESQTKLNCLTSFRKPREKTCRRQPCQPRARAAREVVPQERDAGGDCSARDPPGSNVNRLKSDSDQKNQDS